MRGQASNFQVFSPVLLISDVIELHFQYSNFIMNTQHIYYYYLERTT